ncbi:hypothetical protein BU23DRAFT_478396 [Bimuria novae-zelandiae CBS 107.79]|uniref:Uncharacterized protein n=1 Tax=Bimuria novae-zelandiae CBS 107.79 TaxID=1447943 RepID=A0A6A5UX93_9PLEO|nr:hypothetical protein BU23DRAFT_478396 [Bimuria novae-zelandiae CBS 107.79]
MPDAFKEPTHKSEPVEMAPTAGETPAPSKLKDPSDDDRPPSAQQAQQVPEEDAPEPDEGEGETSEDDIDPAEQIEDFDWNKLHEKYHEAMNDASAQENALMVEFAQLMDYFKIWADAGANQESDRTFHRLHTRMTYVKNSEDKLEKTRQHYMEVVRAFENALALLRNSGFGT